MRTYNLNPFLPSEMQKCTCDFCIQRLTSVEVKRKPELKLSEMPTLLGYTVYLVGEETMSVLSWQGRSQHGEQRV